MNRLCRAIYDFAIEVLTLEEILYLAESLKVFEREEVEFPNESLNEVEKSLQEWEHHESEENNS